MPKWIVEVNDQKYIVEARFPNKWLPQSGAVEVLIDGKLIKAVGQSLWGSPKDVSFEVAGESALLRRRGIVSQDFDLIFGGERVRKV